MEIHELNTKAITNPAYAALDDGTDTYKYDLNAKLNTIDSTMGDLSDLNTTAKDNLVAAINEAAATGGGGVSYYYTSTGASTQVKTFTATIETGDIFALEFTEGNSASPIYFTVGGGSNLTVTFNGSSTAPTFNANTILLFRKATSSSFKYVGLVSSGGGSVTVDSSLSTSSTNPVQNKIITNALPSTASVSGGVISFKNGSNTTLFTVTLPLYNGGIG